MFIVIIICAAIIIVYIIGTICFVTIPKFANKIVNLMLIHPMKVSLIANLIWYGAWIIGVGAVVLHFILKYW